MVKVEQILENLLLQIAREQDFVNCEIKVKPISSGGANFTSTLYNATITEEDKAISMFMKVCMRSQGPASFQTEILFYTKLLQIYEQLQDKHQVPQEHKLAFPKFYGCNTKVYEETVVLENLVTKDYEYEAYDRFKSVDRQYAKSAMTELAKLHTLSFAFSKYYPRELKKNTNSLKQDDMDLEEDLIMRTLMSIFGGRKGRY